MKVSLGKYPDPRSKKERKVKIKIDPYDIWNLDCTLSMIIAPCLKLMREDDDVGIPGKFYQEKLGDVYSRQHCFGFYEETSEVSDEIRKLWLEEFDKMIWAFESYETADLFEDEEAQAKIQEGLDLFSKYYSGLWT